jgi:hypothetical protein
VSAYLMTLSELYRWCKVEWAAVCVYRALLNSTYFAMSSRTMVVKPGLRRVPPRPVSIC